MSGRVPPSSQSRARGRGKSDAARAATRFKRFTGHEVEESIRMDVPQNPKVVSCMGVLKGVIYETVRDGRAETYIHKFAAKDAPLLCVSPNGKQIVLVGGNYTWTERGIVDKSFKG